MIVLLLDFLDKIFGCNKMPTFYKFNVNSDQNNPVYCSFDDAFVPVDQFSFGNLSSWGLNTFGELGLNDSVLRSEPTKVFYNFNDWRKISAGEHFASAINSNGNLYVWGLGSSGQLGDGTNNTTTIPLILATHSNFTHVSCGQTHVAAVKSDGSIWMWGSGISTPYQITTSYSADSYIWKTVSCGYDYNFAIAFDDELWTWGKNNLGQLGSTDYNDIAQPERVGTGGDYQNWSSISCAIEHTVGIKLDGSIHATGYNNYGQLGTGNNTSVNKFTKVGIDNDWKQVSCGRNHTIAIKTNGTLWAWGNNDSGQLGFGVGIGSTSSPIQVGSDISWKQVSCGSSCSSAVKTDGSLWVWGLNNLDQIGLGTQSNSIIYAPTQIGSEYKWKLVSSGISSNFYAIQYNTLYL